MLNVNIKEVVKFSVILLVFGLILGTLAHEILGHGLVIVLLGEEIEKLHILGFVVYPEFYFEGVMGFGYISSKAFVTANPIEDGILIIMGSMSTFLVSLAFIPIFLRTKSKGIKYYILLTFSLYFADMLMHSLPLLDKEPYEGAKILGLSSNMLWGFAVLTCLLMSLAILLKLLSDFRIGRGIKFYRSFPKIVNYFSIFFLVVLILFSGFFFSFTYIRYQKSKSIEADIERLNIDQKISFCSSQEKFYRDFCFFMISKDNPNSEIIANGNLCQNIEDYDLRQNCYWWLYRLNDNTEICEKMEDDVDAYICKAWITKDLNECMGLEKKSSRKTCTNSVINWIDYCSDEPDLIVC